MFTLAIKFDKKDLKAIEKMPKELNDGLYEGLKQAMLFAERKAKSRFDTPGNLKVRTGHYRRSIRSGINPTANGAIGYLVANVVYASIHETGGTIIPKTKKYLRFKIGNRWVTTKKVKIPARPLIRPSITENIDKMNEIIKNKIISTMEK